MYNNIYYWSIKDMLEPAARTLNSGTKWTNTPYSPSINKSPP